MFGFTAQSKEAYTDVPADSWFANAFSIAREAGYYTGYPGNAAKPGEPLTRQDAAVLLARAFEFSGNEAASTLNYPDQEHIGVYAREAVRVLSVYFQGYPNGTLRPEEPITRAEIVTLIDKLVSAYYPAAGTYTAGKIQGSAVVNHGGVVLKDAVIQGNLYLAPGIGDGEVTLDHVTVQGTTFIEGGGAHTVIVKDSDLGSVLVNRRDGQVHVQLAANSPSKLDAGDSSSIDSAEFNQPVQLSLGAGASIASLTVTPSAAGTAITGTGTIKQAVIQGADVTLNGKALPAGTVSITGGAVGTGSVSSGTPGAGGSTSSSTGGSSSGGSGSGGDNGGSPAENVPTVNLVDVAATDRTKSLFVYLNGLRGKNILFGQQHATTEGLSITAKDGTQSDTFNSVGATRGFSVGIR
ncbi:Mannan endo-1,4-beta-mannosidase precursor [Paenibacillus sp. P1XP2]|nr:Mannan endo-1,4-beta-mannosidase precursor [Paenibacillus sp. P1XP2]